MIIFENTPYREDKNLITAYNSFMEILPDGAWAVFRDADTLFLDSFYGEVINRAIRNNPDTGCFTCMTNRIGNKIQLHNEYAGDDIATHRKIAQKIKTNFYNEYEDFQFDVPSGKTLSGVLIVLNKDSWKKIKGFKRSTIGESFKRNNILGVDNQLHKDLDAHGIKMKIIKELYIYHWYRGGDREDTDHLKSHTSYILPKKKNIPPKASSRKVDSKAFVAKRKR